MRLVSSPLLIVPAAPPSKRARLRHGKGGGASRMRASASIAFQSTSTTESDWTIRRRSSSTVCSCVSDQPSASARIRVVEQRAVGMNRRRHAVRERELDGARGRPGEAGRLGALPPPGGAPVDITAARIASVYSFWGREARTIEGDRMWRHSFPVVVWATSRLEPERRTSRRVRADDGLEQPVARRGAGDGGGRRTGDTCRVDDCGIARQGDGVRRDEDPIDGWHGRRRDSPAVCHR